MDADLKARAERRLAQMVEDGWPELSAADLRAIDCGREALALLRTMRQQKADMHVVWIYQIDALLTRAHGKD